MLDVNQVKQERYNVTRVFFLASIAAIGGFLFGFDSGVINGTVNALKAAFDSDEIGTGFNVASMLLGCAAGAFFAGTFADRFGRKRILLLGSMAFIVSAWGSGISDNSTEFIFYRIVGGIAVGGVSILTPAYIGEIAPSQIRGRLIALQQLAIVLGLFFAFYSNYRLSEASGGAAEFFWFGFQTWRWMFWIEIFPASMFFILLWFIPESPRYLVAAGKFERAITVLNKLYYGKDIVIKMVDDIKTTVIVERKPRLSDIINPKTKKMHPIIWVGVGLAAFQQLTGINVVFYYGSVLWQAAGFTEADALLSNVISGSVNIFFTFLAIILVDRLGRRPLLILGALGQALMLGLMAFVFINEAQSEEIGLMMGKEKGILALFAANGYIAFFALTWGPVMWVLLGEMFSNKFRGAALAIVGMIVWLANFLVTVTFPVLLAKIGLGMSYGLYASFGFLAFLFVKSYIKETKGKTLEEISHDQDV